MKLKSLLPKYIIKEAEEGETDNPFASGGDDDAAAEDGAEAGAEDASAETGEEGDAEGDAAAETDAQPNQALQVRFNPTRVRKYNKPFKGSAGQVTAISKHGLTVSLEDGSTVLVNFNDIL